MAAGLTPRQEQVLYAIARFVGERQIPPTISELAETLGMTAPSMFEHLEALERKGFIARMAHRPRGLRLLRGAQHTEGPVRDIPILGRIAAGAPIFAEQNHDGTLRVDSSRYRGKELFALRIKGQSMIGAGILPGDLVIVRVQTTAESGEIVVALVDDEATVKRFRPRGRYVHLLPANPKVKPIRALAEEVRIQGKVIGVTRLMDE